MGFIIHFYIIFGTNLLTGGPTQIAVFLPILVFWRKGIPNGVQTEWNLGDDLSWTERKPEDLEMKSKTQQGGHEAGGRAQGVGAPTLVGPMELHQRTSFAYIYSYTLKISGGPWNHFSIAATLCTRQIPSGAFSGDLPEGDSITEGFYINTIASSMMCE